MAPSKLYFSYHDNLAGFAESWIDDGNSALNYDPKKIADYLIARMDVSGQETVWDYVRITDLDPTKKRLVNVFIPNDDRLINFNVPLNGQYLQNRGNIKAESSDFGGTRFLIRKNSPDLHQARVFFGGFPDNQVDQGGLYRPSGQFQGKLAAFVAQVKLTSWGWFSYSTPRVGYRSQLFTVVTQADNTAIFTAQAFPGNPAPFSFFAIGDHFVIRVSNQNSPRNANGTFTVAKVTDTTCRTVRPLSITNFVFGSGIIAIQQARNFQAMDTMRIMKVVKRGPGRPYGLYRGKQSVTPRG